MTINYAFSQKLKIKSHWRGDTQALFTGRRRPVLLV